MQDTDNIWAYNIVKTQGGIHLWVLDTALLLQALPRTSKKIKRVEERGGDNDRNGCFPKYEMGFLRIVSNQNNPARVRDSVPMSGSARAVLSKLEGG